MENIRNMILLIAFSFTLGACSKNDDDDPTAPNVTVAPETYTFDRNGSSAVDFNGQTTRIKMGDEFVSALKTNTLTLSTLNEMFAHIAGTDNFSDPDLNASSKSIRSKVAASFDYFSSNATDATAIRDEFDSWIASQVNDVFPNWDSNASAGVAGQI